MSSGGFNPFEPADGGLRVYDSYTTDPRYARLLTAGWAGLIAVLFVFNLPNLIHLYFVRKKWAGGWYLREGSPKPSLFTKKTTQDALRSRSKARFWWRPALLNVLRKPIRIPSLSKRPTYLPLNFLQLAAVGVIPILLLSTLLPEQQLRTNPNRLGFLAVACLIPQFLLASKALLPFSILLSTSYVALNFMHRSSLSAAHGKADAQI
jgi:hypothetical protein